MKPFSTLRVTVGISTYQRAGLLGRLIKALEAQTFPRSDFEVIVANDGSTDATEKTLAGLAAETPLNLRVVSSTQNRGPAAGRNMAWRAGTAPVVAFTDDDCVPVPEWLEAGMRAIDAGARVAVGRTIPDPEQEDKLKYPFMKTITEDEGARFFNACNIFYRREDLERVDGFDERFTWGGEDSELAMRIFELGSRPSLIPEAVVHHDVRPSSFIATARETLRWKDLARLIRLHPQARRDQLRFGVFWKRTHPFVIPAFAGVALAPAYPAALSLSVPWLWFRTFVQPQCPGPRRRIIALPGAFAIDLLEVFVMAWGSLRHRTLVL